MKIGTLAGVVAIVAVSTVVHAEVILDFDTLTPESWVGNSYQSSGVIFDVPGWDVRNETFSGIVLVPSSPNYIRLTEQVSTIRFVDPANPAVPATTTFFEFDNPGLIASWGYYEASMLWRRTSTGMLSVQRPFLSLAHTRPEASSPPQFKPRKYTASNSPMS